MIKLLHAADSTWTPLSPPSPLRRPPPAGADSGRWWRSWWIRETVRRAISCFWQGIHSIPTTPMRRDLSRRWSGPFPAVMPPFLSSATTISMPQAAPMRWPTGLPTYISSRLMVLQWGDSRVGLSTYCAAFTGCSSCPSQGFHVEDPDLSTSWLSHGASPFACF